MLFELKNIKHHLGGKVVLDLPSLLIDSKKVYTLLGPNGAGKTTLLNILAFLDRPSLGDLFYNNTKVQFGVKELNRLRKSVVLVDQYPILFTGSVWKNVEYGLKIRKVPPGNRKEAVEEALELVGMQDFANENAQRLSGGETKRVALARGLAIAPKVMLCDEPTANVDRENQEIILDILKKCNKEKGVSLIFATHYLAQAQRLADRSICLDDGKLSSSVRENVFSAVKVCGENGKIKLKVGDNLFLTVKENGSLLSMNKCKVIIPPEDIQIAEELVQQGDSNIWQGSVIGVEKKNQKVQVTVDCGMRVDVLLTYEKYMKKRYVVDDPVRLLLPCDTMDITR